MEITDEAVDRLASWRWGASYYTKARSADLLSAGTRRGIEHQSDQMRESARAALEAAAPLLGPRPLLDRESVTAAIRAEVASYGITPSTAEPKAVDAVMKLARPMPDVQVGYDAVYGVIRGKQQSERPSSVEVNALIWSGVHAFIGAMGIDPKPSLTLDEAEPECDCRYGHQPQFTKHEHTCSWGRWKLVQEAWAQGNGAES